MAQETNCEPLAMKLREQRPRSRSVSMLQVTSCYAGANQRGQKGEQNRAENEQIQKQRKESKGTSEVRRQRHCVRTTITSAPTVSTGPASQNTAPHHKPHANIPKNRGLPREVTGGFSVNEASWEIKRCNTILQTTLLWESQYYTFIFYTANIMEAVLHFRQNLWKEEKAVSFELQYIKKYIVVVILACTIYACCKKNTKIINNSLNITVIVALNLLWFHTIFGQSMKRSYKKSN